MMIEIGRTYPIALALLLLLGGCGADSSGGSDDAGLSGDGDGDSGDGDSGDGDGDSGDGDGDGDTGDGDGDGDSGDDAGMGDGDGDGDMACVEEQTDRIEGVTATTDMGEFGTSTLDKMTDGSGMSALTLDGTHSCGGDDVLWKSSGTTMGEVVFDLQELHSLEGISIWNSGQIGGDRGILGLNVSVSEDDVTYTPLQLTPGDTVLPKADVCPSVATTFLLGTPVDARYVKFDIGSNHGAVNVGVAEVMFSGTNVCP